MRPIPEGSCSRQLLSLARAIPRSSFTLELELKSFNILSIRWLITWFNTGRLSAKSFKLIKLFATFSIEISVSYTTFCKLSNLLFILTLISPIILAKFKPFILEYLSNVIKLS